MEVSDIATTTRDAAFVAIGLSLIGFQRAQVRRRELARQLAGARSQIDNASRDLGHLVEPVVSGIRHLLTP